MGAEEPGSTGYDCRRHELRRIAGASDRPADSYEGLTGLFLLVDKPLPDRDAAPVVLGLSLLALFIIGGGILMLVLAGVAIFKMRKDDFWDEPPG